MWMQQKYSITISSFENCSRVLLQMEETGDEIWHMCVLDTNMWIHRGWIQSSSYLLYHTHLRKCEHFLSQVSSAHQEIMANYA